jgi:tetratricopeptide (TPR) repeat protein
MQNIFYSRKIGVILILSAFIAGFIALVSVPQLISRIRLYVETRSRSTLETNLSGEQRARVEQEIQDLSSSLTIDPQPREASLAGIYRDIASRYSTLGRLGDAVQYYDRALGANQADTTALVEKGKILGLMGELLKGEESIKKAIALEPTKATHYSGLAQYYQDRGGDTQKARGAYIEGLVRTNNDTSLVREFASFLESTGDLSEAYLYWVELAKKLPHDAIVKERINALEPKNKK